MKAHKNIEIGGYLSGRREGDRPSACQQGRLEKIVRSAVAETVLYQLVQHVKAHRSAFSRDLLELNIHVGQEQVLIQLWAEDGLTQTQLAERVNSTPPTLSKMLQRMEREGLVRREREDRRGRAARVFLTKLGREMQAPVEQAWMRAEDQLIGSLTGAERRSLVALLDKLQMPDADP